MPCPHSLLLWDLVLGALHGDNAAEHVTIRELGVGSLNAVADGRSTLQGGREQYVCTVPCIVTLL